MLALRETELADTMTALWRGMLRMLRHAPGHALPIVPLGELGERGLLDRDIGSSKIGQPPFRGPFRIVEARPAASYPVLWVHDAEHERSLFLQPDNEGEVRPGFEGCAIAVWETATRLHFDRDFQVACMAPNVALGGRAWPNFRLPCPDRECSLTLRTNSTLGPMSFRRTGPRKQLGRTVLTMGKLPELPVLDPPPSTIIGKDGTGHPIA